MSNITTYAELLEEKKRLEEILSIQKQIIKQDITEWKEQLRPALGVISFLSKTTKPNTSNPLLAMAINLTGEILLKRTVLSHSSNITKFVVPFLAKKVSSFFLNKNGGTIFHQLANAISRKKNNLRVK